MKIAYYMPFKPLGHPNPSGDLVFGTELFSHLNKAGNDCRLVSSLRCRWLYLYPHKVLKLLFEQRRVLNELKSNRPDIWLSYHSYYKAPDLLGPFCARKLNIPYVIFQGIYSTKRKRSLKTMPGFYLNRHALLTADLVFTNKRRDRLNLLRLLPEERVSYIAPGIHTEQFQFDKQKRSEYRKRWQAEKDVILLSTAMFRPGVKTEGIKIVMRSCAELVSRGMPLKLIIAGDGMCREQLHRLGNELLGQRVRFLGQITRESLYGIYSGADIFVFPGLEESLGMVYLEAQSCGLPVVAFRDWGGSEAVVHGETGLLNAAAKPQDFTENIQLLITNKTLRKDLGTRAATHVHSNHELKKSYSLLNSILHKVTSQ